MKIILDDKRPMPNPDRYRCVRTYEDCIYYLKIFQKIEFISLDYDLGTQKTGFSVLEFMAQNNNIVDHINIHSDHSEGVPKMRSYVEDHFPHAILTFNPL